MAAKYFFLLFGLICKSMIFSVKDKNRERKTPEGLEFWWRRSTKILTIGIDRYVAENRVSVSIEWTIINVVGGSSLLILLLLLFSLPVAPLCDRQHHLHSIASRSDRCCTDVIRWKATIDRSILNLNLAIETCKFDNIYPKIFSCIKPLLVLVALLLNLVPVIIIIPRWLFRVCRTGDRLLVAHIATIALNLHFFGIDRWTYDDDPVDHYLIDTTRRAVGKKSETRKRVMADGDRSMLFA